MKTLVLSPSDMLCVWAIGSIECLGYANVVTHFYDKHGVPVDQPMLDAADREKPDAIVYIGQAGGPFCASWRTFKRLRNIAPTIHINFDAADSGWDELLTLYKEKECFTVTVGTDGPASGPVDIESFHPVDPRFYDPSKVEDIRHWSVETLYKNRLISFGTCGGFPYGLRKDVMEHLVKTSGLQIKPREETWDSYQRYANFYMSCQVVVDCALSAGGHSGKGPYIRTLKTRAIEVGLAGACLLELRGCALNRWAREDVDYATYETPEEAADVYATLRANPARIYDMALRLNKVVREKMNPQIFWKEVFEKAGLAVP